MRVNVKLYGHLAGAVGPGPYALNVETLAEVFVALRTQMPEFAAHLKAHSAPGFYVILNGRPQTYEDLQLLLPEGVDAPNDMLLKIVPGVQGAGDGKGIGMVIAGALIAIIGTVAGGWGVGASIALGLGGSVGMTGVSMLLTRDGVSGALSPQPETKNVSARKKKYFDSLTGTIQQGAPIPIRYGRQTVDGYPVSIKMVVEYDAG